MKKLLAIYGAGGLGREVLSLAHTLKEAWEVIGFIDDVLPPNAMVNGKKVLGNFSIITSLPQDTSLVLAFGNPAIKKQIASRLTNVQYANLIHPSAVLHEDGDTKIGEGCILAAGTVLTTGITLGNHVLLNLNATIGHDVSIGNFCSIMPGVNIAGAVKLQDGVMVGSGANIMNGKVLGENSVIGMGSVVLHDVASGRTVAGVPAKEIIK
jgi:sugar O-acyltransferase (sialic acid O-acetyltransferase NeuD family)